MRTRPLLPLLAGGVLALPAGSQVASLESAGDAIGTTATFAYSGGLSNRPVVLLASTVLQSNPILVALSGDPGDLLAVGADLLLLGIHFAGATNPAGEAAFAIPIPNDAALLDAALHFQAFGIDLPAPAPSGWFAAFSNTRVVTINDADRWQPTLSPLLATRALHQASLLPDGRVLVTGGGPVQLADPWGAVATAEIYDPDTEAHAFTSVPMTTSRAFHAAARLQDGRILVVGGVDHGFLSPTPTDPNNYVTNALASAEIYDPATGLFAATGSMATPRAGHTATLLPDGRVLVTGGTKGNASNQIDTIVDILNNALASAEVWDPASGLFSPVANMSQSKVGHAAVLLDDGTVLLVSGVTVAIIIGIPVPSFSTVCQRFDPATNAFAATGSLPTGQGRALFPAVKLLDGKVLIAGGTGGSPLNIQPIADARLFDPAANAWSPLPPLQQIRGTHAATRLADGRVLVSGGAVGAITAPQPIASCEIFDPASMSWSPAGALVQAHATHAALLLLDGTVYVSGGGGAPSGIAIAGAESYSP